MICMSLENGGPPDKRLSVQVQVLNVYACRIRNSTTRFVGYVRTLGPEVYIL